MQWDVQTATGGVLVPMSEIAAASRAYLAWVGNRGASEVCDGVIRAPGGSVFAKISYNGKVWAPGDWRPGDKPIYNPYDDE